MSVSSFVRFGHGIYRLILRILHVIHLYYKYCQYLAARCQVLGRSHAPTPSSRATKPEKGQYMCINCTVRFYQFLQKGFFCKRVDREVRQVAGAQTGRLPAWMVFVIFFCIGTVFPLAPGVCKEPENSVTAKRTLSRVPDPVIMNGALARPMMNRPIANLRLYAFREGVFEPIRYQIDEVTERGDMVFTEGPLSNKELGNGTFDAQDLLIFMAKDAGDKVTKDAWRLIEGHCSGLEIEITDPITLEKGWCYLMYFASKAPARSSLPAYVSFDYTNNTIESKYYAVKFLITPKEERSLVYESVCMKKEAGANEKNFIDRFKIRPKVKLLFGSMKINFDEEAVHSNVLAYKRGPVRVVRRLEQYVAIPPFNIKIVRIITDLTNYCMFYSSPLILNVPFQLDKLVSSAHIVLGTDYNENAIGGITANSENPKGFLIDGKMDQDEIAFNTSFPEWRLLHGEFGAFLNRLYIPKEALKDIVACGGYIDDMAKPDPPESYPGSIGNLFLFIDLGKVKRGRYEMFMQESYLPHYKLGDERSFQNVMDCLLKIRIMSQTDENDLFFICTLGKKYK